MKLFILAAILAATATGSASAQRAADQTLGGHRVEVTRMAPGADLSNLSHAQLVAISALFSNREDMKPDNNPKGALQVILGWN